MLKQGNIVNVLWHLKPSPGAGIFTLPTLELENILTCRVNILRLSAGWAALSTHLFPCHPDITENMEVDKFIELTLICLYLFNQQTKKNLMF